MTKWYEKHYTHPYPILKECEELAKKGKISVKQVKQWFVNVRRRTHNQFRKCRKGSEKNKKETFIKEVGSTSYYKIQTNDTREYSPYEILNENVETNSLIYYKNHNFYQEQHPSLNKFSSAIDNYSYGYYPASSTPINFCSSNYNNQLNYLLNQQKNFTSF